MAPVQNIHFPLELQRSEAVPDDADWQPSGQANVSAVARAANNTNTHAATSWRTSGL
jgi:hypothetical protein